METLMALAVGVLTAAGFYLMLQRNLGQLVIGLGLILNATNVLIFVAGGLTRANAPLVHEAASAPRAPFADPLPQALILTAIVIGFGVLAFTLVLALQAYRVSGSDDLEQLSATDELV